MLILCRWIVWLTRIHRCWGFGIQSPTDYAFVRSVVNEHGSYYAYNQLTESNWLRRKLGRLYLRLANWRQPDVIISDDYGQWWQAGCQKAQLITKFSSLTSNQPPLKIDLAHITIEDDYESLFALCDNASVVVVEGIWHNWPQWHKMQDDTRTGTSFDLYYCGILFFDKQRYKHQYKVNF
jgi:hypothetical protein